MEIKSENATNNDGRQISLGNNIEICSVHVYVTMEESFGRVQIFLGHHTVTDGLLYYTTPFFFVLAVPKLENRGPYSENTVYGNPIPVLDGKITLQLYVANAGEKINCTYSIGYRKIGGK